MVSLYPRKYFILLFFLWIGISWSYTFRGNNARTGQCSTSIVLPLIKFSTVSTQGPIVSSPIVVNDTVFIGARDSSVYAFCNDKRIWKFKTKHWIDATPAYKDGNLYVGSRDGLLYILDGQTGDSLNTIINNNAQCASPLVYDSLIVFGRGGWNKNINAYNINTARYTWFKMNTQMVHSSAAIKGTTLCYGENGGSLNALNAYTGLKLWEYQTEGGVYLSSPAIENDIVWFSPGSYDIHIYALSLQSGTLLWKTKSSIESLTQSLNPKLIRRLLTYKAETRKRIVSMYKKNYPMNRSQIAYFESLTSEYRSANTFVPYGSLATSSIAVGEENIFVIHKEYGYPKPRFNLTAYNKNSGQEMWNYSEMRSCVQLGFCSSPIVTDSLVFVGWGEGKVYAFHTKSGLKLWEDSLDGDIISSPIAAKGKVYFATTAGTLTTYLTTGYMENTFKNSTYCYPNPARGNISHIQVYVAQPANMKMVLYNFANRPIVSINKSIEKGTYTYDWNISKVANGVYFAQIQVNYNNGTKEKKIVKVAVLK